MTGRKLILTCILSMAIFSLPLFASEVEEAVSVYKSTNGSLYLQPLADSFGASLNSGFSYSADIPKWGFHVRFGLKAFGAIITDDQKSFTSVTEGLLPGGLNLPTVFGDENPITIPIGNENVQVFGVWETSFLPLLVPQLTVGSLNGTEFTGRWFQMDIGDIGNLSLLGLGARHSISQYIPLLPVDIAVGAFWQSFKVGDIIDATALYAGVQASIPVSILTFYGGIGYEKASMDISYTYSQGGTSIPIAFSLDADNHMRAALGLGIDIWIFNIHADYNMAAQSVLTLGAGVGF